MKIRNLALIGAAALFAAPVFATSYYGGVEDRKSLDYDYNDVVFSITGGGLQLNSSGQWFNQPVLGTSATHFWNHSSLDASQDNIGYCIYGGGTCNGGIALDPAGKFLAVNQTANGSANDVTFSANGTVHLAILLQNTTAKDSIGWYAVSDPSTIYWLNPSGSSGDFHFNPVGTFGLVVHSEKDGKNFTFFSQSAYGNADLLSHFAFFDPVPEPAAVSLVIFGLLGLGGLAYRRKSGVRQS